ncbi:MAG: hypothetical protein H0W36_16015 [Gemmatimonadetes bacterium]|nr:hypothetical protein [Gemmatimonadota bacterium]
MIEVRGVEDVLVRPLRVTPRQAGQDVGGSGRIDHAREGDVDRHAERHRAEFRLLSGGGERVELLASEGGEPPGGVLGEPALDGPPRLAGLWGSRTAFRTSSM